MKIEIKTPCDQDGYALLQCHFCGEYFKLKGDTRSLAKILEIDKGIKDNEPNKQ